MQCNLTRSIFKKYSPRSINKLPFIVKKTGLRPLGFSLLYAFTEFMKNTDCPGILQKLVLCVCSSTQEEGAIDLCYRYEVFCTVSDIKKCSVFLPLGEINAIYFRNKMDPSRFDLPLKDGILCQAQFSKRLRI